MVSVSGWIALSFFVLSFYLAIRLPFLNRVFDGLKPQLNWHHWTGLMSGFAMLWHLAQLFWSYGNHFPLLFDLSDFALLSGWLAIAGVILAIFLAFFHTQLPYRRWRSIHLVTCFSLAAALIHTLLIFEPRSLNEWAIFLLAAFLSLGSVLMAVILPAGNFWGRKYCMTQKSEPRADLLLIKLRADKGTREINYQAGHFIYLRFLAPDFTSIWHPFTIISQPSSQEIELLIKTRGIDTSLLKNQTTLSPVSVSGPFGTAFWKHDQSQMWIAYGVGVAIFLAAIRSFPQSFHSKVHFICCDKTEDNLFFREELDRLRNNTPNFTWETFIGSGQEFTKKFERQAMNHQAFSIIRICGHPGFQKSLQSTLIAQGVKRQAIQLEGLL